MAAGNASALALAARLRALDDDAVARLVRDRGVRRAGIRDWFDLAEALLDRHSIQDALSRLDRGALAAIAIAGELAATSAPPTPDELAATLGVDRDEIDRRIAAALDAGLVGTDADRVVPWDAVVEQLRSWPSIGLPGGRDLVATPPPPALEPVGDADARFLDRGAADRAFATVTGVAELLRELREEPARRLSRGGLALPDARRLAPVAGADPDDVEAMLELAELAGVLAVSPRAWSAAADADDWLARSRAERWGMLARAWLARLSPELRSLLRDRVRAAWGEGLAHYLRWRYPAAGERVREQIDRAERAAALLGLVSGSTPTTPSVLLLTESPEAATAWIGEHFPAEIDRVYLQHDLTVVAPGPLAPEAEALLRRVAVAETRGVASTYRITAASVTRALTAGDSAESILELLGALSLSGVPQPVEYLVRDAAARFGALRVGAVSASGESGGRPAGSYVRSTDAALLGQLLVDPNVATLALARVAPDRLESRFDRGIVHGTLVDARYPAVAEDASGAIVDLRRPRAAARGEEPDTDTAAILVARIRDGGSAAEPGDEGWIVRQLELAAKNRVAVTVRVRMPDASEVELVLEPAAIAGGRLRGRDRRADLERTLPVSSITAVEAVHE